MTLAQFVVTLAVALTAIAVALIVAAVILMEKEQQGGVTEPRTLIEFENGPATITPINRARVIEWIPVREKLPESCKPVLVTIQHGPTDDEVAISEYWSDGSGWGWTINDLVIAWAELPDPYKK